MIMKKVLCCFLLLGFAIQYAQSQTPPPSTFNRDGRWSIGVRGGGNMWFNDFNKRKVSGGGELYIRYAFTRKFSLGVIGAYEILQAGQDPVYPTDFNLSHPYIETKGISGDLVAWYHFIAGSKFSPYLYIGVGGYSYKRKVENKTPFPADKSYTTLHIPLGFGFDFMFSKNIGFNLDLGARAMDDVTDNWKGNVPNKTEIGIFDWYATGKAGINFYLGSSDSDDNDGDGLTNGEEKKLGTDPNKADTDGDGLSDGEEANVYKTDPKKADSDGDGLNDGDEVKTYKTDPNKADSDGDGLSDGQEVNQYKTDPLKADTDGDGLNDGQEVNQNKTDPAKADTDNDGLSDGQEVNQYKTDPLKADTDGGSVYDGQEIANNTKPLDPTDDVPKKVAPKIELGKSMVLEGIVFKTGKAIIDPSSEETLKSALKTLNDNPEISVEVRGYTDNVGKAASNMRLSQKRAEAVRWWLIKKGVSSKRIYAKGYGQTNPIGDNATPEGKAKNRRIEFFRTK
jgi:outer membrane protein OmpA-like peptidoglycan-associated protein